MAKRYIGIELDGATARVALLTEEGGNLALDLREQKYSSAEEAREVLTELIGGARPLGDFLVTALPAGVGFFRSLNFPFKERSKLAAVLPSELDAQIPVALDNHTCAMLAPREQDEGYAVDAAAVDNTVIEALLEHFPQPEQQPRRIDLFPHALAGGLGDADGLLTYCSPQEVQVVLVLEGRVVEYRLLPCPEGTGEEEVGRFVLTQLQQLERTSGREDLPFWVCGSAVTDNLLTFWQTSGRISSSPELPVEQEVSTDFLPAVLLALSEQGTARQNGFNFRTGSYAPQGQLEALKKKLVVAAVLFVLCLMVLGGSSYFDYDRKAQQAKQLKQQLEDVFHQAMPETKTIVDVPMQMQSRLKELRQQAMLLGVGDHMTALKTLETLSRLIDPGIKNDLKELTYNGEQVKLDGYTDSFDSVNRITQAIEKSPLFSNVEISEARMAADGGRVDFQLQVDLNRSGGEL